MPDRLPSLIVLVGFWIPPAVVGWVAAKYLRQGTAKAGAAIAWALLVIVAVAYAGAWFFFNLSRMPPYIPGATPDPTSAPSPEAVAWLAIVAGGLILPGSALAFALAFRYRARMLQRASASRAST